MDEDGRVNVSTSTNIDFNLPADQSDPELLGIDDAAREGSGLEDSSADDLATEGVGPNAVPSLVEVLHAEVEDAVRDSVGK